MLGRTWLTRLAGCLRCLFALAVISSAAGGAEISTPAPRDLNEATLASRRDGYWQQAQQSGEQGKWQVSLEQARLALDAHRQLAAGDPAVTSTLLEWTAHCQANLNDYEAAAETCKQLEELRSDSLGVEHWQTANARIGEENYRQLSGLSAEDRRRALRASEESNAAVLSHRQGNSSEAIRHAEQSAETLRKLLGADNVLTTTALSNVGLIHAESRRPYKARPVLEGVIQARLRQTNLHHPDTLTTLSFLADVYQALGETHRAERLYTEILTGYRELAGSEHPQTILALRKLLGFYCQRDQFDEAVPLAEELLRTATKLNGEEDSLTNSARLTLGVLHRRRGKMEPAKSQLEKGLAIQRRRGDAALESLTAEATSALAAIYRARGNFAEAYDLLFEHRTAVQNRYGAPDPRTAHADTALAQLCLAMGDFAQAERRQLTALSVVMEKFPREHPEVLVTQYQLAKVYVAMGDHEKAVFYLVSSITQHLQTHGEADPLTVEMAAVLATVHDEMGFHAEAEKIFVRIRPYLERRFGTDSPEVATLNHNLARLYEKTGRRAEAEQLFRLALECLTQQRGTDHPDTAAVAANLARVLVWNGKYHEAGELAAAALKALDESPGSSYTVMLEAILPLAMAELALGETESAAEHLARGLVLIDRAKHHNATVQSERQQIVVAEQAQPILDLFLSLPAQLHPEFAYQQVLAAKGAAAVRARRYRDQPTARGRAVAERLQSCTSQLANMLLRVPKPASREPWHERLFALEVEKEAFEVELAFEDRQASKEPADLAKTLADLQNLLPEDAVLIDLQQFERVTFAGNAPSTGPIHEQCLTAFIVRHGRPIVRVDLGRAEPIASAIKKWRSTNGFSREKVHPAAQLLGTLIWQPLATHLDGCKTVLVSPAGATAQLPWSVLPGQKPETYLIEDVAIGVVPIPQLLLRTTGELSTEEDASNDETLLVVGDIDFDAQHGGEEIEPTYVADADEQRRQLFHFEPLQGTSDEIKALRRTFEKSQPNGHLVALAKDHATEAAFRGAAPDCRWLHIATHGFFAPPNVKRALADRMGSEKLAFRRSLSSATIGYSNGLALAGANHHAIGNGDDGILMAAELATFDLRKVELAVLSGCETGLGEIEAFEGALGLQRSLQIAGARTTITSLWNVSDQKTQRLMDRFYQNLWERRLPKLEALREAQLWILNTGGNEAPVGEQKRQPPHFWAAFTLSGDWR